MLHVISLGAGVQSSTMALMFAHGELTPMPDCAIFADTGAEPKYVYDWLDWLETQLPFPVHRVMHKDGLLKESLRIRTSKDGHEYVRNFIPGFTRSINGAESGMMLRSCTKDFKIDPVKRKQRAVMKAAGEKEVSSYIGISTDEIMRMKPSRVGYITNKYPLIDSDMTRGHCLEWMANRGYPQPPKSACYFCPYQPNQQWQDTKINHPDEFKKAVDFEKDWNEVIKSDNRPKQITDEIFLHRSLVPLSEADFRTAKDFGQVDMFNDECEGMCGV